MTPVDVLVRSGTTGLRAGVRERPAPKRGNDRAAFAALRLSGWPAIQ
jgi:hypothetical protein